MSKTFLVLKLKISRFSRYMKMQFTITLNILININTQLFKI